MTLIEALTVIVVIGMLSSIAIPAFYRHRDEARDSTAQANARAAQSAAIQVAQENDGVYSGPEGIRVANLVAADPSLADVELSVPLALPNTYTIRVQSETGNTFDVSQTSGGATDLTCATASDGGCPSDGTWD
jgi:type II secretory pathway pseudopilin PulG